MSEFVSSSSFDSACFVHTVMQDEMQRNQRHPKLFCVVLVHSGTDYLSTYFGTFPFWYPFLSFDSKEMQVTCVNASASSHC